jgi:hypothetical protein
MEPVALVVAAGVGKFQPLLRRTQDPLAGRGECVHDARRFKSNVEGLFPEAARIPEVKGFP